MGNSLTVQLLYDIQLYQWSAEEFCEECAVLYTVKEYSYPSRSSTFYYRVTPDKLIIAMDDGMCKENRVRVNMEIVAVREAENGRCFKFGPVKYKDSGTRYNQRSRNKGNEVLYLSYEDSSMVRLRRNLLGLYKRTVSPKTEYVFDFSTAYGEVLCGHGMMINCDPSNGIYVNFSGLYYLRSSRKRESLGTQNISGMPPDDVMEIVHNIRNELKIKDRNSVGAPDDDGPRGDRPQPHIYNLGNFVYNSGNSTGDGSGCITNHNDQHHRHQTNDKQ